MKFRSFGDGASNRIKDKLKTISLSSRKIEQKRVAVVNFRMDERGSNSTGSSLINSITDTPEITNVEKACDSEIAEMC